MAESTSPIKNLPLTVGVIGGSMLMLNRLLTPALTDSQARSDVVGVILSAILILVTLLWEQIQPKPPEAVVLEGEEEFELADDLPESIQTELAWASHLLLTNTVTKSLVIYYGDRLLVRRGILPEKKEFNIGAIAERVLKTQKAVYLVTLKVYPGRVEFDYFPENTQGIICQPINKNGLLVVGTNIPRSYTKQDEKWVAGIAEKLAIALEANELKT
ncbi:MAG: cofactor assembly of complex C subunit B [Limnothrix sp.]